MKRPSIVESRARATMPLGEAVLGAMQGTGATILLGLIKERAGQIPAPAEAARSLLATAKTFALKIRTQGVRETALHGVATARSGLQFASGIPRRVAQSVQDSRDYFSKLPSLQDKTEYVVALVLYLLSFLGGFAVGFQLPKVDLKVARRTAPADRIVLHGFPVMAADLAMAWLREVLVQARDTGSLNPQDFRRVESLIHIARNLRAGVLSGAAALAWQKRTLGLLPLQGAKDVEVSLQNQAFAHAEHLFRSLTGAPTGRPET